MRSATTKSATGASNELFEVTDLVADPRLDDDDILLLLLMSQAMADKVTTSADLDPWPPLPSRRRRPTDPRSDGGSSAVSRC